MGLIFDFRSKKVYTQCKIYKIQQHLNTFAPSPIVMCISQDLSSNWFLAKIKHLPEFKKIDYASLTQFLYTT